MLIIDSEVFELQTTSVLQKSVLQYCCSALVVEILEKYLQLYKRMNSFAGILQRFQQQEQNNYFVKHLLMSASSYNRFM